MINITELIKHVKGFNPIAFETHKIEEALIKFKCRKTEQGWFAPRGQYLGKTPEEAIRRTPLRPEKLPAKEFYAFDPNVESFNEDDLNKFKDGTINELHGVKILGVPDTNNG